ncbi:unnamed protein product, partial [Polarella glacialis]
MAVGALHTPSYMVRVGTRRRVTGKQSPTSDARAMADGPTFDWCGKVMKDEGLVFSILQCLCLAEARQLWRLHRLAFKVLDGKVIPLLALFEREWSIVSHYLDSAAGPGFDGQPRFEYS